MQKESKAKGTAKLFPLVLLILFVLTRKQYEIPSLKFFIPRIPSSSESKFDISEFLKRLNIKFVTKPKLGWLVSLKSSEVSLPVKVWLPPAFFIAIPQIKSQLKEKLHIKPRKVFGILYGYDVSIDKITFWA